MGQARTHILSHLSYRQGYIHTTPNQQPIPHSPMNGTTMFKTGYITIMQTGQARALRTIPKMCGSLMKMGGQIRIDKSSGVTGMAGM